MKKTNDNASNSSNINNSNLCNYILPTYPLPQMKEYDLFTVIPTMHEEVSNKI